MLTIVTPPAAEPVAIDRLRAHLRLDHTQDDALLAQYLAAARAWVEARTARALIDQVWRLTLDDWPAADHVRLPRSPLQAVHSVSLLDENQTAVPFDLSATYTDARSHPGRLCLRAGRSWPLPRRRIGGIEVVFSAGYGPDGSAVPAALVQAILSVAAHWYEVRTVEALPESLETAIGALIAPFRLRGVTP